jgi:hypothetical protein
VARHLWAWAGLETYIIPQLRYTYINQGYRLQDKD